MLSQFPGPVPSGWSLSPAQGDLAGTAPQRPCLHVPVWRASSRGRDEWTWKCCSFCSTIRHFSSLNSWIQICSLNLRGERHLSGVEVGEKCLGKERWACSRLLCEHRETSKRDHHRETYLEHTDVIICNFTCQVSSWILIACLALWRGRKDSVI